MTTTGGDPGLLSPEAAGVDAFNLAQKAALPDPGLPNQDGKSTIANDTVALAETEGRAANQTGKLLPEAQETMSGRPREEATPETLSNVIEMRRPSTKRLTPIPTTRPIRRVSSSTVKRASIGGTRKSQSKKQRTSAQEARKPTGTLEETRCTSEGEFSATKRV